MLRGSEISVMIGHLPSSEHIRTQTSIPGSFEDARFGGFWD